MPSNNQTLTSTEEIPPPEVNLNGWVFETNGCHFDLAIGFSAEWRVMHNPFIVANLTTTSPRIGSGELLELAAILVDTSGAVTAKFSTLVNITEPVSGFVRKETGITQTEVDSEGRPLGEAMKAFLDFVDSRPVFIHDAPFAQAVLKKARELTQQAFANPVYDTLIMAILAWSPLDCGSIAALAEHLSVSKTGQRAIDDAKVTLAVLMAVRHQAMQEAMQQNFAWISAAQI